jgi:hypothetical protein
MHLAQPLLLLLLLLLFLIGDQRPTTNPRVEVNESSCQFSAS